MNQQSVHPVTNVSPVRPFVHDMAQIID